MLAHLRRVTRGVPSPHALVNHIAVKHLARALAQQGDDVELELGQVDGHRVRIAPGGRIPITARTVNLNDALSVIDGHLAKKADGAVALPIASPSLARHVRRHATTQDLERKRLEHVVIGARRKTIKLVHILNARR